MATIKDAWKAYEEQIFGPNDTEPAPDAEEHNLIYTDFLAGAKAALEVFNNRWLLGGKNNQTLIDELNAEILRADEELPYEVIEPSEAQPLDFTK